MQKIGIYGGTFNPPHLGHVQGAEYAVEALCLDRLLIMPSCHPPHKTLPADAPTPAQRLEMLKLCFETSEKIQISDLEIRLGGVSYTVDTVKALQKEYPNADLYLLLGTDMFLSFENWYRWEEILPMATLSVMYRGDKKEQQEIEAQKAKLEAKGGKVILLENPVVPISSTQLRRLMTFRCEESFLPTQIRDYIRENNLYHIDADYHDLSMEELEKTVISLLKPNRVAHVLGCRDTAKAMAETWGVDPVDAARAGLLHDITKALDGPLQLSVCRAYGQHLSDFSSQNPKTLHALTGSLVAERIFGEKKSVVDAICSHTTGKPHMNTLEKIIYVADYMEPNRAFDGVEEMRRLAFTDLDGALEMGLEMTVALLKEQGRAISPESSQTLEWLKEIKEKKVP